MMFLFTCSFRWAYTLHLIELSMNWFDGQATERTAAPQRFFYVRNLWQPFLWACRMGGTKVPTGTLFQSVNPCDMPTLCVWGGYSNHKEELAMNNTINSNTAAKNQNFLTIPKEDCPRIVWKLQSIHSAIGLLHGKLLEVKKSPELLALPSQEVHGFCDVLHDNVYAGLKEVSGELIESDLNGFREVGQQLQNILNHAEFILNLLWSEAPSDRDSEYRNIYKSDVGSIFFLVDEMLRVLLMCIDGFKNSTASGFEGRSLKKESYESVMTERIKAIQPKFIALCDKYIFPGGSQLLTDPKSLGTETEALRNEIRELQNQMPVKSEESMDCGLAIDHLDFLTRLIDSKFDFRVSDLLVLSVVADQASAAFGSSLSQLKLHDGGCLGEDSVH